MSYIEWQRKYQISLIEKEQIFRNAEAGFVYAGLSRPYILKDGNLNLYKEIAQEALDYFKINNISWWRLEQIGNKPSGHILSSQIACINHLFPIRKDKEAVIRLLKTIDNDFVDASIIESDTPDTRGYIAFEAVCAGNYLHEDKFTRGANSTSVDAFIIGRKSDGKNILVPIEWKYTESYTAADKSLEDINKTQWKRYSGLLENSKYLKNINLELYYIEPFYQLMRQTLWAEQMVAHGYADSIGFINVHVIPEKNEDLLKSGNRKYNINGRSGSLSELWAEQMNNPSLYKVISPNLLLAPQPDGALKKYLETRYWQ